jgi:hypothetical protein
MIRQSTLIGNPKALEEHVDEFDGLRVFKELHKILWREHILRLEEKDHEVIAGTFVVNEGVASKEMEHVHSAAEMDNIV